MGSCWFLVFEFVAAPEEEHGADQEAERLEVGTVLKCYPSRKKLENPEEDTEQAGQDQSASDRMDQHVDENSQTHKSQGAKEHHGAPPMTYALVPGDRIGTWGFEVHGWDLLMVASASAVGQR